jgi:Cu(I)/Ag(I) efflux system membrane fusion protein
MKNFLSGKAITYLLFAAGGLFFGWLLFHSSKNTADTHALVSENLENSIWTCAMHPQIRMNEPGKCPICGMELIPLSKNDGPSDSAAIKFTKEALALANVQTTIVSREDPVMEVRLYGKIQTDERLLQSQVSHLPGRIDKLFVNFTGESVQKGQILALIYSPELITAQQELLEALKTKESQPGIYEASKDRLRQWKLSESQISAIVISGVIKDNFELISNTSGIVTGKRVNNGDYVSQGSVLYEVSDLSKVWAMFDAYESDLPYLTKGDKLTYTVQAIPGMTFEGNIAFIDPVIDPVTRVAKVRAEINNRSGALKPEMFVTGIIKANLEQYHDNFIIPRTSVLWTGRRSVVYLKLTDTPEPEFKIREIELGPMLGSNYVVMNGLNQGDEIVTQGSFSVDAAAQLEGKPSMMNPALVSNSASTAELKKRDNSVEMNNEKKRTDNSVSVKSSNTSFKVSGNCEMCKDRIESAAKSVEGVTEAVWDSNTKLLSLVCDERMKNIEAMHKAIALAGHDTEKIKATVEAYNSLPDCCKYRN